MRSSGILRIHERFSLVLLANEAFYSAIKIVHIVWCIEFDPMRVVCVVRHGIALGLHALKEHISCGRSIFTVRRYLDLLGGPSVHAQRLDFRDMSAELPMYGCTSDA